MSKEKFWAECSTDKEDLGEVIALCRKNEGLSEIEFAEKIGCTDKILKSSENGKGAHVYGTFVKMCETYNLKTRLVVEEDKLF
jgi:ribosome-binding protein aMBF1 (putative translation factor)